MSKTDVVDSNLIKAGTHSFNEGGCRVTLLAWENKQKVEFARLKVSSNPHKQIEKLSQKFYND